MFRNLIDKIGESTLTALAEAGISPNRNSDSERRGEPPPSSNDRFSIGEVEEGDGSSRGTMFSSVDLSVPGALMSPMATVSRRSSASSIMSDVSSIRPGSSFHMNASDVESASELGDSLGYQSANIEQLHDALIRNQKGYHKYKGRYTDLARHYRELERDNVKTKKVLTDFQDRCLRREAELKEQCLLEQRAKAHLEEILRNELDEKDHLIKTLITKIELLKSQGETNEANVASNNPLVLATSQDHCLETQQNCTDGEENIDLITEKTEAEVEISFNKQNNPILYSRYEEMHALVCEMKEKTFDLEAEKTDVLCRLIAAVDELTQAKEEVARMEIKEEVLRLAAEEELTKAKEEIARMEIKEKVLRLAAVDELTQAREEIARMEIKEEVSRLSGAKSLILLQKELERKEEELQYLTGKIVTFRSSQEKGAMMNDDNQSEVADINSSNTEERSVQEKNNAVLPPSDESVQDRIWTRAVKNEELTTKRNEIERFMKITQFIDDDSENNVLRLKHVNFLCKKLRGTLLTEPLDAEHLLSEDIDLDMDEAVETLKTKLDHAEYQRLLTAWLRWKRTHCNDVNLISNELTLVQTLIETLTGILEAVVKEVQELSDQNKDMKQQIVALREEQTTRENHVTYITQTLEDAEHRNDQLLSEILSIEKKTDSLKSQIEDLQKQKSGLQEELNHLNQNNKLVKEDAKESIKNLYSQIEEFKSLVVSLKSQIEDLQKQNTDLQEELREYFIPTITDDMINTCTGGEQEPIDYSDELMLMRMRNALLEEHIQRMKDTAVHSADIVNKLQEEHRFTLKRLSNDFEKQLYEKIQEITEAHEMEIGLLREEEGNEILQLKNQLKMYKSTAKQAEQNLTERQTLQEDEMEAKNLEILTLKKECLAITAKYEADLRESIKKWRQHSDQDIEVLKASHKEELQALSQEWQIERKSVSGNDSTPCGSQQELEHTNRVALAAVGSTTGTLEMLQREVMSQKQEMDKLKQVHKLESELYQKEGASHDADGSSRDYSKEYLRNVLFEFLMEKASQSVLVKVLADLVELSPEQTKQVVDKFEQKQKPSLFSFGML